LSSAGVKREEFSMLATDIPNANLLSGPNRLVKNARDAEV